MKKLVLFIPVLIIIVTLSFPAYSYNYTFSAQTDENVNIGHSFDICVTYNGDKALSGVWLEIEYDTEYFSFKKFSSNDSVSDFTDTDGKLSLICLFNKPAHKGDVMYLTFTSKTGVSSDEKSFKIHCIQAVNTNLENIDNSSTPELKINVVRKSDNSEPKADSSHRTAAQTSAKNKSQSSKASQASSQSTKSKSVSVFSSSSTAKSESSNAASTDTSLQSCDSTVSSAVHKTIRLYDNENKSGLVIAGAVGMLAVIGIIVSLYKLGKTKIE